MELRFDNSARRELDEAYQWYETQQPGLGFRYIREVEHCSRMILRFPLAAPEIATGIRRVLVPPIPLWSALSNPRRNRLYSGRHAPTSSPQLLAGSAIVAST